MNLRSFRRRTALILVLACGLGGYSLLTQAVEPGDSGPAALLVSRATGQTPMLDDLRELCDLVGGRPTGSEACERAVDWAAAKFRGADVDSVWTESFPVPNAWLGKKAEAECLAPARFTIHLAAAPFSASTKDSGPLEASLVDAGEGTQQDFAKLGEKARGAMVLVRSSEMKTLDDLFAEYFRNGPLLEAAARAGVAGIFLQSTRPRGLLYRHPISLDGAITSIPSAIVSREDAGRLARLADRGEVRVRVTLANDLAPRRESRNVIAEIRGREKPEEIVLIGAHLDSWDLGTGGDDNGVNSALVIDVARGFKELGLRPRRTVRFVLFTGEEQGMLGSEAYVLKHGAEMGRHAAMVTFDTGSGRTTGFYLNGREELRKPVNDALAGVASLGAFEPSLEAIDGTDNFDFLLSGVPNLVAKQDWTPYLPNYHAASDVFDWVDQRQAKANSAIAAALVWGLAENADRPAPRQARAQVEKLIRDTRLDEQMKAFGQWAEWEAGKRGVSQ